MESLSAENREQACIEGASDTLAMTPALHIDGRREIGDAFSHLLGCRRRHLERNGRLGHVWGVYVSNGDCIMRLRTTDDRSVPEAHTPLPEVDSPREIVLYIRNHVNYSGRQACRPGQLPGAADCESENGPRLVARGACGALDGLESHVEQDRTRRVEPDGDGVSQDRIGVRPQPGQVAGGALTTVPSVGAGQGPATLDRSGHGLTAEADLPQRGGAGGVG